MRKIKKAIKKNKVVDILVNTTEKPIENPFKDLEDKRMRYIAKIEDINDKNEIVLSNIRVLGHKIILGDHLTMNKSQEMSNLGLKVGDIIE